MEQVELSIETPDRSQLAARLHPAAGTPRAVVLIVPAMAVPQSYYAPFAGWLAEHGHDVVTFDFRGMGESAPPTLRGFDADILTWARQDCAAMLAFARTRAAGRPMIWIGHSLGGQILAMTPGNEAVAAAVTVASGVGYWRENAYPLRYYSWFLWFFAVGVEGPAMRESYRKVSMPLLSLSFTDDEYMSERNVAALHRFYENARRDMRRIAPADVGARRIGHFGFFRAGGSSPLWRLSLDWLKALT